MNTPKYEPYAFRRQQIYAQNAASNIVADINDIPGQTFQLSIMDGIF